jgi:cytochrome c biogenesis protein CcmG/thiol:disulfide interchange protein DsbE
MPKISREQRNQISLIAWLFVLLAIFGSAIAIRSMGLIRGGATAGFLSVVLGCIVGIVLYLLGPRLHLRVPMRPAILVLVFLSIAVLVFLGLTVAQIRESIEQPNLPNITLDDPQFVTYDGMDYRLSDYRGSVIVLNVWASWSESSIDQIQIMQSIWDKYYDRGVRVFGVTFVDTENNARSVIAEWKITYPNGPDPGNRISTALGATGVPETYIFAKDGTLAEAVRRPIPYEELSTIVEQLLDN